jgi:hypothetical protein
MIRHKLPNKTKSATVAEPKKFPQLNRPLATHGSSEFRQPLSRSLLPCRPRLAGVARVRARHHCVGTHPLTALKAYRGPPWRAMAKSHREGFSTPPRSGCTSDIVPRRLPVTFPRAHGQSVAPQPAVGAPVLADFGPVRHC